MALTGRIITQTESIPIPMFLLHDIYGVLREFYGVGSNNDLNCFHRMEYKLYELCLMHLPCCSDHDCVRRQLASDALDRLREIMDRQEMVLFAARPVTDFELIKYRQIITAIDDGWPEPLAEWLVFMELLDFKNIKKF